MTMLRPLFSLLLLASTLATSSASAGPLLDPSFGNGGLRALNSLGGFVEGIGSCPHANGSISVVGYRPSTASLVIARVNANGNLDASFSGDGVQELPIYMAFASDMSATSCAGVGNAAPEDDRIMVVGTVPGTHDLVLAALLDLHTGGFDSNFFLGGAAQYDLSGLLFPPQNNIWPYPRARIRGVFPGPAGGWLIVGQLDGHASGAAAGFIVRTTAGGAIDALSQPNAGGFSSRELTTARVGADGDIRALGGGEISGLPTWGLLRLHPVTLQPIALSAGGVPDGSYYRVFKGRQIGGGVLVAAALRGNGSAFSAGPELLVVRGDDVDIVALPTPPLLDGVAVGPSGLDGSAAATGAVGNRAVFGMGLRSLSQASAGYYAAVVQLGNGAATPDIVDTRFANNGAGSFRYLPAPSSCGAGTFPPQRFANLSSWGDATLLVGSTPPDCGQLSDSAMLGARLSTDGERLHRDGFE